ncbi:DUF188 domain-containing protein [Treponema sp.]
MKIYVDADSCPRPVREAVVRAARRTKIEAIFAANRSLTDIEGEYIRLELCPAGPDAADDRLVELARPGDLALTRDVPLAARLVERNVSVIDDRGKPYTKNNIGERLSMRDFLVSLATDNLAPVRTSVYGRKELKAFADGFDRELTRLAREELAKGELGKEN